MTALETQAPVDFDTPYQTLWNALDRDTGQRILATRTGTSYASQRDVILAQLAEVAHAASIAYSALDTRIWGYRAKLWKRRYEANKMGSTRGCWT